MALPPAHRLTTASLAAAHPFVADTGLGGRSVYVGRDLLGGPFFYDPFELYASGILSNPNAFLVGNVGRGKSSFAKTFVWRHATLGRRAWILDPKGEYAALAAAWGVTPLRLRRNGPLRLNPLDPPGVPAGAAPAERQERATLVAALAEASLDRVLLPTERAAIAAAVAAVSVAGVTTLPRVVQALLDPSPASAAELATTPAQLASEGRSVALELRRMVAGDLVGLFDGETSRGLDLSAALVVVDLSALAGSGALSVLMAAALGWMATQLAHPTANGQLLVVDEAWALFGNVGVARWLRSAWKLARAWGVANLAITHRVSDLEAAGPAGSEAVQLAAGLLADSETRIVYAQPPGEADAAQRLLGLTPAEVELLPRLGRGVALWRIGSRGFLVRHELTRAEQAIVDTDRAMRGNAAGDPVAAGA